MKKINLLFIISLIAIFSILLFNIINSEKKDIIEENKYINIETYNHYYTIDIDNLSIYSYYDKTNYYFNSFLELNLWLDKRIYNDNIDAYECLRDFENLENYNLE